MNKLEHFREEPYRFLFLIGLGHLAWGLLLWVLFAFDWVPYPGMAHARSMIEGFLLSFSMGFLMTALPRFSKSVSANWLEAALACILGICSGYFDLAALGSILFLIVFAWRRRLFSSSVKKPPFFLFVQGGLVFGLVGLSLKCFDPAHFFQFKSWLYEGMIFLWLCGIGSRILVMLLSSDSELMTKYENRSLFLFMFVAILIQPFHPTLARIGDLLRLLGLVFLSLRVWKLHHLPRNKGTLAWGVWLGLLFFNIGQAVKFSLPNYAIHAVHLIFVSGYCVLALMVAVRVSIAHSGDPIEIEKRSPRILVAAILLVLAGLTRFSAGLMPTNEQYTKHLLYAALIGILAIPLWTSVTIPRLARQEEGS